MFNLCLETKLKDIPNKWWEVLESCQLAPIFLQRINKRIVNASSLSVMTIWKVYNGIFSFNNEEVSLFNIMYTKITNIDKFINH